jgi:hypothetical protein
LNYIDLIPLPAKFFKEKGASSGTRADRAAASRQLRRGVEELQGAVPRLDGNVSGRCYRRSRNNREARARTISERVVAGLRPQRIQLFNLPWPLLLIPIWRVSTHPPLTL